MIFLYKSLIQQALFFLQLPEPSPEREIVEAMGDIAAVSLMIILPIFSIYRWTNKQYPLQLKLGYRPYLQEIPLYRRLPPKLQKRFERRVQQFINTKKFIARDKYMQIDDRKKALIAATAVELTFGFRRFYFDHFSRILVYRDDYYSTISKQYHAGEVNIRGMIVLSWSSFEKGNSDRNDGRNLGVHEMAHALKLENKILNSNYDFIDPRDYHLFLEEFELFTSRPADKGAFLRNYARSNVHEFFAVCCENFVERPAKFQEEMPVLYKAISRILRMDPLEFY
ncbi:zinc-dependent peptidase [Croceimicrobium sp.]|uniref:zinc-dependent peptidase n=1 Tax=Croceimicrobium sp. TaxID=2828340 RepID=UPI003BACEA13